jgi:hypothetical protein
LSPVCRCPLTCEKGTRAMSDDKVVWSEEYAKVRDERDRLEKAIREAVNTLGPDHFGGELQGLLVEGNEALHILRRALVELKP